MAIPLPGQRQIKVNNWYLPPETSNFLKWVGFLDSEFLTELHQFEIICANLTAHDSLYDPIARPIGRAEVLAEKMMNAIGAFLSNGATTRQDPSIGDFSSCDVTIVHESL